jgi:uncharacterized protein YggU (UPF0235/DUF167 family)
VSGDPVARLAIRVQPRARVSEIAGERDGVVMVRVAAPPVDGKANAAVCALVAQHVGVSKSSVRVIRGAGARDKVLEVRGIDSAELRRALGLDA